MNAYYKRDIVFLILFIVFLVGSLSAVTYLNSSDVFDASIFYVNNEKSPYYVIVNVEDKVDKSLNYEVEVVYGKQNLVVGTEYISCIGKCEIKVNIKKIFFDKYKVFVRAEHEGNYYEKVLDFRFEKPQSNLEVNFNPIFYKESSNLFVTGVLTQNSQIEEKYLFEFFPKNQPELKQEYDFVCNKKSCSFKFEISTNIILGEYTSRIYSSKEAIERSFFVKYLNQTNIDLELDLLSNLTKNTSEDSSNESENLEKEIEYAYTPNKGDIKDHSKIVREGKDKNRLDREISNLAKFEDSSKKIKIKKIKEKTEEDIDLEFEIGKNSLNLNGINSSKLKKLDIKKNKKFGTDILFVEVENNTFEEATVVLEKTSGYVDKILVCSNFAQNEVTEQIASNLLPTEFEELAQELDVNLTNDIVEEDITEESILINENLTEINSISEGIISAPVPVLFTSDCVNGWIESNNGFEQNETHVWFKASHFSAYTGSLTIFNPQSYPVVQGIWTVEFTTNGTSDLWIYASNGTTWSNTNENNDLKFLRLMCGNTQVNYQFVDNKVFVPNYMCLDKSYSIVKVITGGVHVQTYQFGETLAYAKNFATERGSGFLAYIDTTDNSVPRYKVFDPITLSWSAEQNATDIVNTIEEIQVTCSVARHECALLTVDNLDDVKVQFYNGRCWNNGTTCGQIRNLSAGATATDGQRAQMMYEAISGDLLIVWSGNAADNIGYIVWNGSDFVSSGTIFGGTLVTTGTPNWFEMAQEPGTNNISIIYKTTTPQAGIFSYTGNSNTFGCEMNPAVGTISGAVRPGIDITFEQVSADMFAVMGITNAQGTEFKYTTRPNGSCTYTSFTSATMSDASDTIRVSPAWGSNNILIMTQSDSSDDNDKIVWNGSALGTRGGQDTACVVAANGNRLIDGACSRVEDICVVPYADNAGTSIDWYSVIPSTQTWTSESDASLSVPFTTTEEAIECTSYPFDDNSEVMCIFEDDGDDIFAKVYDPTAGSWFDTESVSSLEGSSSYAEFKSFSFNWVIFNSPYVPIVIDPLNATTSNPINLNLTVEVTDPNEDVMNVSFYWGNNTLIGTSTNVDSGSNALMQLSNLSYLTNYSWYVVVYDGMYYTTSDVWNFTTKDRVGTLSVIMNTPSTSGDIITVFNTKYFKVNVTIVCEGILDESCYNVSTWAQYNNTVTTFLNISNPTGTPFYTSSTQPQWCVLDRGQNCTKEWLVTPNGTIGSIYNIKAFALSNRTTLNSNNTLNSSVNITTAPANSVLWATPNINLGSTLLNLGDLTQSVTIRVVNNHTGVNVTCISGNCSIFTENFVDNTNYNESSDPEVIFTCLDSVVGSFAANFSVVSTQDTSANILQLSCQVNQTYGTLSIVLNNPLENVLTNVSKYDPLKINTTLSCIGTSGALCGDVSVNARYSVELSLLNWWDLAYPYRLQILINETSGITRTNVPIIINVTSLHDITNCLTDTRIVHLSAGINTEVVSQILSTDNSTWCEYVFLGNVSANASNENRYYVYFGVDIGDPNYVSSIVSTNDSTKWDMDNGLVTWQYKWTGGDSGGPWRSFMTTPSGRKVSSIGSTSGDDSFQNADAFVSFAKVLDGPIYQVYNLQSVMRGNQTMKVYAEQNWYEINNTYNCVAGCNDYWIIGIEGVDTSARSWYDMTSSTATGNRDANRWFFVDGNTPKTWGIGVILSGVDDRPFNGATATTATMNFATGVDGFSLNNYIYTGGWPYWIFTGDNNTLDANMTWYQIHDPIDNSKTGIGIEESFYYNIINTTYDTPMYTNGSQPLTCNSLTEGNSCTLVWDVFGVTQGQFYININSSSSLADAGRFSSNNSLVSFAWPTVNLSTPINNSISRNLTNFYYATFNDSLVNMTNATLYLFNESGSLIGTNTSIITGNLNSSNLSLTVLSDGIYYWNYKVYDTLGYSWSDYNYTLTIDSIVPIVNLSTPENNTIVSSYLQYFSANFSDIVQLKNATLLIWNSSGSLIGQNGTLISGKQNSSNLSYTFTQSGIYVWNYLAYDIGNNSNISITNRTIIIDTIAPAINFTSPTDANNSFMPRSWTYINTTIYDLSFNQSWLEWNGVNESVSCNAISTYNYSCFINKTNILNGNYTYRICANDTYNFINCTEQRIININITLPEINVSLPVNGTKYNYDQLVPLNISTLIAANNSWFQIDLNGTNYSMNQISSLNWNASVLNLTGGYHLVTFFANDSINNIVNASAYFYIVYEKNIFVKKDIANVGNNSYFVILNITNNGRYIYYDLHDFIDINFNKYNLSLAVLNTTNVTGIYTGNIQKWNFTLAQFDSAIITYNINGTSDYKLGNNFIVGSE